MTQQISHHRLKIEMENMAKNDNGFHSFVAEVTLGYLHPMNFFVTLHDLPAALQLHDDFFEYVDAGEIYNKYSQEIKKLSQEHEKTFGRPVDQYFEDEQEKLIYAAFLVVAQNLFIAFGFDKLSDEEMDDLFVVVE